MSDSFRDKEGKLIYIKENPYTNESVRDPNELIEFQQSEGLSSNYIESWAFTTREYSSDGGGVRSICRSVNHFDSEQKAINYLYTNGWEKDHKGGYKKSRITDGWSASERAELTCEKIKLRVR